MPPVDPSTPLRPPAPEAGERLDSWKEIAAYLKRDESTVRRWEEEGLPVHRHPHKKKATVFAYKSEIDRWLNNGHSSLETTPDPARATERRTVPPWVAVGVFVLGVSGVWLMPRSREQPPSHITQLTTSPGWQDSPTWSPDGRTIAYAAESAGKLQIYLRQVGTGEAVRWSDRDAEEGQPAWSPDGSRIAFVARCERPDAPRGNLLYGIRTLPWHPFFLGSEADIWIRPALGGHARRIAEDAYYPAWSPDGKKLVFVARRQQRWRLFIQEVDTGSEAREVAVRAGPSDWSFLHPAWSPDGRWIAFTGNIYHHRQVYVVPSDGGDTRAVTEASANALMPSWSSDGQWLYFSSDRGGPFNLWKIRFDDTQPGPAEQVTVGPGDDLLGRLDPTGGKIAFVTARIASDIWELDLESGRLIRLTSETTFEELPRPSPDGTFLAFISNRVEGNHLWLLDRRTGALARVSSSPVERYAFWSINGDYLYYWGDTNPGAGPVWQYEVASGNRGRSMTKPVRAISVTLRTSTRQAPSRQILSFGSDSTQRRRCL